MTGRPHLEQALLGDGSGAVPAGLAVPGYDRSAVTAGVAHIGVGNFHRVHQGVYLDRVLHQASQQDWGILGVGVVDSPASAAKAAAFAAQDNLHTVTEFAPDGSHASRVIGSMVGYESVPADPGAAQARLLDPAIRIVTMTIGESSYNLVEGSGEFDLSTPAVADDLQHPQRPPRTVFRLLVDALAGRRRDGTAPFTVMSCDNLRGNGDTIRRSLLGYAAAVDPELAQWIEGEVHFPNCMVDRIAPLVDDARRAELNALAGVDDAAATIGEDHLQWVIEDDFPSGRPRWEEVGVTMSDQVAQYEAVKGRMLNACHVLMSYPAVLLGHRFVHEAMADPLVYRMLRTFVDQDVIPLITPPTGVRLPDYRDQILSRFANPAVRDQLLRIAMDGAAKIPVFHTVTLRTQVEQGLDPSREALLLLCFRRYLSGVDDRGAAFDVHEPLLSPQDRAACAGDDPRAALRLASFSPLGLEDHPGFVSRFDELAAVMTQRGVATAIEAAIEPRG
ncbi:MAG: mannitol dehydrogenase family protein [Kineosporiaceae bacterium]